MTTADSSVLAYAKVSMGLLWGIEPATGAALWETARSENLDARRQAYADVHGAPTIELLMRPRAIEVETGPLHENQGAKPYLVTAGGTAIFDVSGPLSKQPALSSGGTSTVALRRQMMLALRDPDVTQGMAILDTPGGAMAGNDDCAAAFAAFAAEKPLTAYVENLCASCGYWLAACCTQIVAARSSFTGCIGSIFVLADTSRMAANAGVEVVAITSDGAEVYKGAGAPGTPLTPEHRAYFKSLANSGMSHFAAAVKQGRSMSDDDFSPIADGRLYSAQDALALNLIDAIGSFADVLSDLEGRTTLSTSPKPEGDTTLEPQATATPKLSLFARAAAWMRGEATSQETQEAVTILEQARAADEGAGAIAAQAQALAAREAKLFETEGRAFALAQIKGAKALPAEEDQIAANYLRAALDDAQFPLPSGTQSRVAQMTALFDARPKHDLFGEAVPDTQAAAAGGEAATATRTGTNVTILPAAQGSADPKAAQEARTANHLSRTANGRLALKLKAGTK